MAENPFKRTETCQTCGNKVKNYAGVFYCPMKRKMLSCLTGKCEHYTGDNENDL